MTTRQTVTIQSPEDRQKIAVWARNVDLGTIVEFRKKTRSHEQSAKMHAMLGEVADQVVWYGTKLKVEDWKNMFTASLRKAQVVPGIDAGTVVPLGIHTSTMTVDEMSNMIEAIYAFGADPEHPVVFKDPKPDEPNPDEGSPPPSSVDGAQPSAPEADAVPPETSASPLSDGECAWLVIVARMLWACTPEKPTEHALEVLNNQRIAAGHERPEALTEPARLKAGSIYKRCKETVEGKHARGDTLRYIAGIAGCDVSEIGG